MDELKEMNDFYRNKIQQMIKKTDDTHILRSTYTVILTHLRILAEKGGAA